MDRDTSCVVSVVLRGDQDTRCHANHDVLNVRAMTAMIPANFILPMCGRRRLSWRFRLRGLLTTCLVRVDAGRLGNLSRSVRLTLEPVLRLEAELYEHQHNRHLD